MTALKTCKTTALALGLAAAVVASAAHGETSGVSGSGFTVTHSVVVAGEPEQVWQAFTQLPRW